MLLLFVDETGSQIVCTIPSFSVSHYNCVMLYFIWPFKGGRGQIKQKKKTVPQKITIAKIPRAKKKYVTRVCGLATFGKWFCFVFYSEFIAWLFSALFLTVLSDFYRHWSQRGSAILCPEILLWCLSDSRWWDNHSGRFYRWHNWRHSREVAWGKMFEFAEA